MSPEAFHDTAAPRLTRFWCAKTWKTPRSWHFFLFHSYFFGPTHFFLFFPCFRHSFTVCLCCIHTNPNPNQVKSFEPIGCQEIRGSVQGGRGRSYPPLTIGSIGLARSETHTHTQMRSAAAERPATGRYGSVTYKNKKNKKNVLTSGRFGLKWTGRSGLFPVFPIAKPPLAAAFLSLGTAASCYFMTIATNTRFLCHMLSYLWRCGRDFVRSCNLVCSQQV